jgi:hypothetical protein
MGQGVRAWRWVLLVGIALVAFWTGVLATAVPAHADGPFSMTLSGTLSGGKAAPTRNGGSVRKVALTLHTSDGAPRLAIALTARETSLPQGQTEGVNAPNGGQVTAIGTLAATGSLSDPTSGLPLFDARVRGAILPDSSLELWVSNTGQQGQLALQVTFPPGDGHTLVGTATGTLTLAADTPAAVVADVWGSATGSVSDPTLWYVTRGAAATAYVLLAVVVALGISLGLRAFDGVMRGWRVLDLHQLLTLVMLGFVGLHLLTLALDPFKPFGVLQILWPFDQTYRPLGVALGVLSLYLVLVITASAYLRRSLSRRVWYGLHLLSYVAFITLTIHGVLVGTDTRTPWMLAIYCGASAMVLWLTLARLFFGLRGGERREVKAQAPARSI